MSELRKFTLGLMLAFGVPWLFLVVIPWVKMRNFEPIAYGEADEEVEAPAFPPGRAGRVAAGYRVYAEQGCAYCHTQMVRPTYAGSDLWREGWGGREEDGMKRETRPRDYYGESYAFLGVHRNGPDLSNVGWRRPDAVWHHLHLYDPRGVTEWSVMPRYDALYETRRIEGPPSADALPLQGDKAPPEGYEVVPTSRAKALVDYLQSLKKDYRLPAALTGEEGEGGGGEGGSGGAAGT